MLILFHHRCVDAGVHTPAATTCAEMRVRYAWCRAVGSAIICRAPSCAGRCATGVCVTCRVRKRCRTVITLASACAEKPALRFAGCVIGRWADPMFTGPTLISLLWPRLLSTGRLEFDAGPVCVFWVFETGFFFKVEGGNSYCQIEDRFQQRHYRWRDFAIVDLSVYWARYGHLYLEWWLGRNGIATRHGTFRPYSKIRHHDIYQV